MSQIELLDYLRKRPNELFTSKELEMIVSHGNVTSNLKKLRHFSDIPLFMVYRGSEKRPFYVYIEKARKFIHKRGYRQRLSNTMEKIV